MRVSITKREDMKIIYHISATLLRRRGGRQARGAGCGQLGTWCGAAGTPPAPANALDPVQTLQCPHLTQLQWQPQNTPEYTISEAIQCNVGGVSNLLCQAGVSGMSWSICMHAECGQDNAAWPCAEAVYLAGP